MLVAGVAKKYPTPYEHDKVEAALTKASAAVRAAPGGYLLGQFSYAGALSLVLCDHILSL